MRAIGVGGLASRRNSERAVQTCLRAEQAPRTTSRSARHHSAAARSPAISTLACRAKSRSETPAAPRGALTSGLARFVALRDAWSARKQQKHPQRSITVHTKMTSYAAAIDTPERTRAVDQDYDAARAERDAALQKLKALKPANTSPPPLPQRKPPRTPPRTPRGVRFEPTPLGTIQCTNQISRRF